MQFHIHAMGETLDTWTQEGISNYEKRFSSPFTVKTHAYPIPKRQQNQNVLAYQAKEYLLLTSSLKKSDLIICLDEHGKHFTSKSFANHIGNWQNQYSRVCFLLGGPDGHHTSTIHRAQIRLSLSPFTMPHGLARLVLIEQLYRAMTLIKKHPYHR